jgi:hypothetical protein
VAYDFLDHQHQLLVRTKMEYTSLDEAARTTSAVDRKPDAASLARRSISIFSRRGTETPMQIPAPLSHAPNSSTNKMNDSHRTWLRRRSFGTPKPCQRGTILKAVPPAEQLQMSRLEWEMATSPNEEIMSAISEHPPTQTAWSVSSDQALPSQQLSPSTRPSAGLDWHQGFVPRTESVKRRETETRIGVWVNGVVHWDDVTTQKASTSNILANTGLAGVQTQAEMPVLNSRPNLRIAIPGSEYPSLSTTANSHPRQQAISFAPADHASKAESATPHITVDGTTKDLSRPGDAETYAAMYASIAQNIIPGLRPKDRHSTSSSTASSTVARSDVSDHSKRSSATSMDHVQTSNCQSDDTTPPGTVDINKPLPPVPVPNIMRSAPAPPTNFVGNAGPSSMQNTQNAPYSKKDLARISQNHLLPRLRIDRHSSLSDLDKMNAEFLRASPYAYVPSLSDAAEATPTLSQAEDDLQAHLGTIAEVLKDDDAAAGSATLSSRHDSANENHAIDVADVTDAAVNDASVIRRSDSVHSVMSPPARAPTLPKRSRKREWRNSTYVDTSIPQVIPPPPKAPGRRKSESLQALHLATPPSISRVLRSESEKVQTGFKSRDLRKLVYTRSAGAPESSLALQPAVLDTDRDDQHTTHVDTLPEEQVLLRILSSLTSMKDLFSMAVINKGMYRVFKENELPLIQIVARNESPAAWELREWRGSRQEDGSCDDSTNELSRTPMSYMWSKNRDEDTVVELKRLILDNCQSFMRRETAISFAHKHHPDGQRFTDALWRVWTFCTIFGSNKGREEDITGQLDWLKGGTEANNQTFSATVNTNLDFDMGSVLLNAPDHFAEGNRGGLSAVQLYDMTELWNCLSALLVNYQGQIHLARHYGVFASCGVSAGDIEMEEHMLEEWTAFVMTLGLDVVLELAKHAAEDPSRGFEVAKANGWTDWTPSVTGSRATFLREPAARLYEERISAAAMHMQDPHDLQRKEDARKRVAALAAEIRLRRQTSGYKRLPKIDMHNERAMSMVSRHPSALPSRSIRAIQTTDLHHGPRYHAYSTPQTARPSHRPSRESLVSPMTYASSSASARPSSPMSVWSARHISPIIEDRVEGFNRLSLANLDGVADSTVECAVRKITEMGFSVAQATQALKMTDMGDGLRVDRAVDMLLRN